MRQLYILVFILIGFLKFLNSQTIKYLINSKKVNDSSYYVKCFTSLAEARRVHPDSVNGLVLKSNGFKDFPKEILKYKNLRVLDFDAYLWQDVLDSLTEKDKKEYFYLKSHLPNKFVSFDGSVVYKYYKKSQIKVIPEEIKSLNKLELISFTCVTIKYKNKFKKIYKYLPKTEIHPLEQDL